MPEKPTRPFGTMDFGKDGSVRPAIQTIGKSTKAHERKVGEKFILLSGLPPNTGLEVLEEADHDLRLTPPVGGPILIQCTEVVYRDFLLPKKSSSREYVLLGGETLPIDVPARNSVLTEKLKRKINKHYSKPANAPLVLLIWSVTDYVLPITDAANYASQHGTHPFDEVYAFDLKTTPRRIWPLDPIAQKRDPTPPPAGKSSIYVPASEMTIVRKK